MGGTRVGERSTQGDIILAVPSRIGWYLPVPSVLSALHFHDEEAAYAYVEAQVWLQDPVCPRCNSEL